MSNTFEIPDLYFDGQFIDVLWDNLDETVNWFSSNFNWKIKVNENWKVDPRCTQGRMVQLDCGTWLVSYLTADKLPHHFADRGTVQSNIKLCFKVKNIGALYNKFASNGIRLSSLYNGPVSQYFDMWITTEGIRLTIQEDPSLLTDEIYPSWVRIGVNDLEESITWYETYVGMKVVEYNKENNYVIMRLKMNHTEEDSLWILEQLEQKSTIHYINDQVQPYCWIQSRDDFFKYHQLLKAQGIKVSEIGGFISAGMVSFHFYDPSGNRFNVSSM